MVQAYPSTRPSPGRIEPSDPSTTGRMALAQVHAPDGGDLAGAPSSTDEEAFLAVSVGVLLGVPLFTLGSMALFGYAAWAAGLNVGAVVASTLGGGLLIGIYLGGLLGMAALAEVGGH